MLLSTLYGYVLYAPTIFNVGGGNIESPLSVRPVRKMVSM